MSARKRGLLRSVNVRSSWPRWVGNLNSSQVLNPKFTVRCGFRVFYFTLACLAFLTFNLSAEEKTKDRKFESWRNSGLKQFTAPKTAPKPEPELSQKSGSSDTKQAAYASCKLAAAAYSAKDYYKAIDLFNKAVSLESGGECGGQLAHGEAYLVLGQLYAVTGKTERAVDELGNAIRLMSDTEKPRLARGKLYLYSGKYDLAISDFDAIIRRNSSDGRAYYLRGLSYAGKGQYTSAIDNYDTAILRSPGYAAAIKARADAINKRAAAMTEALGQVRGSHDDGFDSAVVPGGLQRVVPRNPIVLPPIAPDQVFIGKTKAALPEDGAKKDILLRVMAGLILSVTAVFAGRALLKRVRLADKLAGLKAKITGSWAAVKFSPGRADAEKQILIFTDDIRIKIRQIEAKSGLTGAAKLFPAPDCLENLPAGDLRELSEMFLRGKKAGLNLKRFSPDEQAWILGGMDTQALFKETAPLSALEMFALAKKMSKLALFEKSADLLLIPVVLAAVSVENGCLDVIDILERSGKLDKFLEHCNHIPKLYTPYAEAFFELGKYKEARLFFSRKRPQLMTNRDISCIFECHVRLCEFSVARLMADQVLQIKPIRDNVEFYSALAAFCEEKNETELALTFYRGLVASDMKYRNADKYYEIVQRYEQLLAGHAAIATIAPVAQKFSPAPAVIKTGVAVAGQTIGGRYELKGNLGEGAMGVVYEAWDRKSGQAVAVKRMHAYLKEYPAEYGRFRKEAEIVGRLKHPNIVCIHELLEQGGEIYLVFDYVAGKTLYDVLKEKKRFSLQECKDIFSGVCDAVHYAHKNNVIHRDLKPANIMLASPARAMVMDFGLASELRDGLTRVTHQTMSGTPAFMAPEQHAGTVKRESDIYAMGVCFYEMLTGELPFQGFDGVKQKKLKDYREATSIVSWLPTGVDEVISRALEPEPSQRYADALDFWDAMKDL